MGLKTLLSGLLVFFLIITLSLYWFVPFQQFEFTSNNANTNFSLYSFASQMQFYENMRFPDKKISYKISDCPLQKKDEMLQAFNLIENKTILEFFPVLENEEITISCDNKHIIEEGLFIAGEGGPTNITITNNFNVISKGSIILIKESKCSRPNIGVHELLHVLGFNHSENKNNIMYSINSCSQTLGDIPNLINEIYAIESYPDLAIEKASVFMKGKYLDINMSIRNNGLIESEKTEIIISSQDTIIKKVSLDKLNVGYGIEIKLINIWVPKLNIEQVDFFINSSFDELNKKNNKIILKIKK